MTSTLTTGPSRARSAAHAVSRRPGIASVLRWEARKLVAQHRARAILAAALVGPIPVVVVISAQARPPKDTLFGRFATDNGFALALLILGFASQWLLPLLSSIIAGDIFASEDQHGTWKTVLTRSASRTKLFWAKVLVAGSFTVLVVAVLSVSTIASSVLIAGHQPLVGLTGQSIPAGEALRLVAGSWVTMLAPSIAFTCLALLLSITTRSPAGGMAIPVVLGMVMQLVGTLGGVAEGLRPLLLTTPYEAWHGLLTQPQFLGPLTQGLLVSAVWSVLFLTAGFAVFRRRDITGG